MKKFITLIILTVTLIILSYSITLAQTSVPGSIQQKAREITISLVQILSDGKRAKAGSGVIIAREDNEYDVLTVAHNLRMEEPEINVEYFVKKQLKINTHDRKLYNIIEYSRLKLPPLGDLDLAIIRFRSEEDYQTATFLDSQGNPITKGRLTPRQNDLIYVSGFPQSSDGFRIDSGRFVQFDKPWSQGANGFYLGGYSVIYRGNVEEGMEEGMSGGAILNSNGDVIGIHGRKTEWRHTMKLGIDINLFWQSISPSLQNRIRRNHRRFSSYKHLEKVRDFKKAISARL